MTYRRGRLGVCWTMQCSDRKINNQDRIDLLAIRDDLVRRGGLGVCYTMHCSDRKINDQDRIDLLPKIIAQAFNSIFQDF
ncbi:hypothetical protein E3N88_13527 [Mikania micrantha]|uniref:Uncharacterized protein n=1 Tax=Mikania micrantha TaxID=192012 RepID=A0A5N6P9X0_9ASTR|nr:hypothetical protein E3N88_13527 [Mikania micrantha]